MAETANHIHGDVSQNGYSDEIKQLYDYSCAVKSQQIIMRDFGIDYTEEQLVRYSYEHGWYNNGTLQQDVGKLLMDAGVPCHQQEHANVFNLVNELSQGHKVIVGLDSDELWHNDTLAEKTKNWISDYFGANPDHALIVAGIDTSNPNDIQVIVKDPGTGDDGKAYPLNQFMDAWADSSCFMVSTDCAVPTDVPGMQNFDAEVGHIDNVAGVPYSDFQVFNNLSYGVPVFSPMTNGGLGYPMESLVTAYFDYSMQPTPDFSSIFMSDNYMFNSYLDPTVVTPYMQDTFNMGFEQISFSPDNDWTHYMVMNNLTMPTNNDYNDFLQQSYDNFMSMGDSHSAMLCDQQMMMLDYCDNYNLDFGQTFYQPFLDDMCLM